MRWCSEDEERLVRDLFRGYNKLIRPVQNMTQKVDVRFGLAFVQLINVNEKNQIMKSNVWLRLAVAESSTVGVTQARSYHDNGGLMAALVVA
ncbi:hypothetical protein B566_EDAN006613, partial [Ephemera danica]